MGLEGTLAPPGDTIEIVLPLAHPSPQYKINGKSIGSAVFFAQLTAESLCT